MLGPPGRRPDEGVGLDNDDDVPEELVAALPEAVRRAIAERVVGALREAAQAWPGARFPPAAVMFIRVAERLADEPDTLGAVARLHVRDLCLATACGTGEPRAMAQFEQQLMPGVPGFVRRIDRSPHFADEVKQLLREKLFVGRDGSRPKICEYAGKGPLDGWLRVVAVREAHNLARTRRPGHEPADADLAARASMPDPELAIARKRSHEAFGAAFEAAMGSLTMQQRTLLRLHYLDGLSSGSIAEMERVSSATVRRWIDAARRELFAATRRFLAERFHFSSAAVDLVWGDLGSDMDLSVSRLLRSQLGTP